MFAAVHCSTTSELMLVLMYHYFTFFKLRFCAFSYKRQKRTPTYQLSVEHVKHWTTKHPYFRNYDTLTYEVEFVCFREL